jgi:hypothetical protein
MATDPKSGMVGGTPDGKAAHQRGEEPAFSWLGLVLVLLGFAATTVGLGLLLIAWSARPRCGSWDHVDFVGLASDALRFALAFSGAMAMAIGMVHAFPTAESRYREMVLLGLLAIAGGLVLVAFSEVFVDNIVGLLMLVVGGLSATFGVIRIASRELLYKGEKGWEG